MWKKQIFFDSVCECRVVVVINLMTTFNIEEEKTLIDFFRRCGIFVTLSIWGGNANTRRRFQSFINGPYADSSEEIFKTV